MIELKHLLNYLLLGIFISLWCYNFILNNLNVKQNQGWLNLPKSFDSSVSFFHISFFLFLVTFGNEVTKIQNYYVPLVYVLKGEMGKTEKNRKENHATKVTKIPKTKSQKYKMNETTLHFISTSQPEKKCWMDSNEQK